MWSVDFCTPAVGGGTALRRRTSYKRICRCREALSPLNGDVIVLHRPIRSAFEREQSGVRAHISFSRDRLSAADIR